MAFPWNFESNFETGNTSEWTSTGGPLSIAHASTLAGINPTLVGNLAPFRGAFVAKVDMSGTTDAHVTSTAIDVADGTTSWFRFYMFLGKDVVATAADIVSILKLTQAGGGTVEITIGLSFDGSGGIFLGGSDGTAAATFGTTSITLGVWHAIEVKVIVSTIGAGVITTYLDGVQQSTETGKTQAAAIGDGKLGMMDRLATTTGTVLFDQFVQDDARVYPIVDRYPQNIELTKSSHVFVGPGTIENIELMSGAGTDNVLAVYDTNRGNTNDFLKIGHELKNTVNNDVVETYGIPFDVKRGCFVSLSGTNPRALVKVMWAPGYSQAGARNVAGRLRTNPLEVF